MRYYVIPEIFFKSIAEKGKLYSRLWFYWLSEHVDEIFDDDFIEKQEKKYKSVSEIREIYNHGVQLLQQEFRFIEKKKQESKPIKKEVRQVAEKVIQYMNKGDMESAKVFAENVIRAKKEAVNVRRFGVKM